MTFTMHKAAFLVIINTMVGSIDVETTEAP